MSEYSNEAWDHLFQFLADDHEAVSRAEVQSDLQRLGVSAQGAIKRVFAALDAVKAREELRDVGSQRRAVVDRLTKITATGVKNIREKLQQLIQEKLSGSTQAAYFHKLEGAATDADLGSLLEDIERLNALGNDIDDTK
jgi:hypothetical protein